MPQPISSFQRLSPRAARIVLLCAALLIAACVAITASPISKGNAHKAPRSGNDIVLYSAIIDRVAAGEYYYDAAGDEQRARGYPASSVFNWRTPLVACGIAQLPNLLWAKALYGAICFATLLLTFEALARDAGVRAAALGALLMIGALLLGLLGESIVMPVVWAGTLIAASLAAYGIGHRGWGVALGLAALFARELAGPYCAIACVMAAKEKRWKETFAWLAGLAAYAAFYAWHVAQVSAHRLPTDEGHAGTWLQAGGLAFVISLAQIQAFLIVLPQAVAAVYFALAMLGAASAKGAWSQRISYTLASYVALFGLVGYDFNQYWGVLIAPLFALAAAKAPCAVADLVRAAGWQSTVPAQARA